MHDQSEHNWFSITLILSIFFFPVSIIAQPGSLRQKVEQVVQSAKGKVGVAIMGLEDQDSLTIHGKGRFPMQSVYKFPLALAVLHWVDQGTLSLEQKVRLTKRDLLPNTLSPLREKYPEGNVEVSLRDLLYYTVALSDNNGCDILFRLLGGTKAVETYIHGLGVKGIAIAATEEEMHRAWPVQYTNWTELQAMLSLLGKFYRGKCSPKRAVISCGKSWPKLLQNPTDSRGCCRAEQL